MNNGLLKTPHTRSIVILIELTKIYLIMFGLLVCHLCIHITTIAQYKSPQTEARWLAPTCV